MIINKDIAISTSKILLVPYLEHHVPTYHEWMKNEDIREATASEPLTLEEEYGMQRSWRNDADKLTFITCLPRSDASPSSSPAKNQEYPTVSEKKDDSPDRMIGDVNLFISEDDEEDFLDEGADAGISTSINRPIRAIGELELMVASKHHQGCGMGRASVLVFLQYIVDKQESILAEFAASLRDGRSRETPKHFEYLRVKIHQSNHRSIGLFESIGLEKVSEEPNYFGELELRLQIGRTGVDQKNNDVVQKIGELLKKYDIQDYKELKYIAGT